MYFFGGASRHFSWYAFFGRFAPFGPDNVPVTIFLTGPGVTTLPIQMLSYVEYYFDPTVSAISVLLMFLTIILMFLIEATMGLSFFTKK